MAGSYGYKIQIAKTCVLMRHKKMIRSVYREKNLDEFIFKGECRLGGIRVLGRFAFRDLTGDLTDWLFASVFFFWGEENL